jgi:SpoVK/Ycf46/Vps4 family AAA+-type ATPase
LLQSIDALSPPVTTLVIDCIALTDASRYTLTDLKLGISGLVRFAFENPPFCLFFDNIDSLIPGDSGTKNSESAIRAIKRGKVIAEFLRVILRDLKPNRSIILAATALTDSVSLAKLFTHHERLPSKLTAADRELLLPGASLSEGHSMMELVELAATGTDNREKRKNLLKGSKTLVSKSVSLGGLDHQIQQLVDAITLPLKFPSLFTSNSGESIMATGAFIVGPSGTGKTALIDHVVRLTNLPVEIVRGPDLLDKYIGASEQGVRRVFEKAAAMAPCLVVFDTIDALCPRRGSESTGVTDRVVNQMLCYLDGVEKVDNVFVIAVSSRPDMVDPALTRPGRLDLTVLCDIPTHSEREEIIKVLAKEFGIELKQVDVDSIDSSIANGLTGADLRAGFVNAKIISERRRETEISFTQLLECLREIKPSISERDAKICDQVFAKYRKTNPPIKASPQIGTRVLLH